MFFLITLFRKSNGLTSSLFTFHFSLEVVPLPPFGHLPPREGKNSPSRTIRSDSPLGEGDYFYDCNIICQKITNKLYLILFFITQKCFFPCKIFQNMLSFLHRAKRRVSGALYPQSAICGVECSARFSFVKNVRVHGVMKSRSYAIKTLEPCQALTGASLKGSFGVP